MERGMNKKDKQESKTKESTDLVAVVAVALVAPALQPQLWWPLAATVALVAPAPIATALVATDSH